MSQPTPPKPQKKGKSLPAKFIIRLGKWVWTTLWHLMMSQLAPRSQSGEYIRPESQFRNTISTQEGNPYQPAAGRYRLYVGLGCPWAHRTLVVRALKGLEDVISVSVVSPSPIEGGWVLNQEEEGCRTLAELYQLAQPGYSGRSTVPVLWDNQTKTIVNNESAEIIILLNSQFNEFAKNPAQELYPEELQGQIEQWNEKIYPAVNNGVYRCGFAQTQEAYNNACNELFATLDEIDMALERSRYLCGDNVTLADVRLFTTLFRFDIVYYGLFKCNRQRIQDYKNLGGYLRDLYQLSGVAGTCDLESVKRDYYGNLFPLNPGGIIPTGPDITNLLEPHERESSGKQTVLQD
ncbi:MULTISPECIES: glutathione S-transferase family protein [unclassified Coleofasciculus]|uniref:glutathione S-transferase family protein n=1 Tax=unclassified Coleofasciculus TaxID=2692782 RepID=UPI001880A940|nr:MULTISPECIES: glutathione S-transferase family protein [unclassified Coleofasciculus]MBE9125480.1 glutathione S-transferase family protein [Coleofasciculus sp. LEGE 07081]MBE9147451.1 glutathione S-transferase family protein [Coleofasciculus sp. LEGE 07092]